MIFKLPKKDIRGELGNRPREADIVNRVLTVAAIMFSKSVLRLFDNLEMRVYVHQLDPQHTPPHRLERLRITIVMIDAYMREWDLILAERRELLYDKFRSREIGKSALSLVCLTNLGLN